MNDISLVFLDIKKAKQTLKDLERDTNITWVGGKELPTEYMDWENNISEGFVELRINQPDMFNSKPYLTYGTRRNTLENFLEDNKGFMFLIK